LVDRHKYNKFVAIFVRFLLTFNISGIDGNVIMVNRDVDVASLTYDELKKIFSGEETNWSAFGGSHLPIKVFDHNITYANDIVQLNFIDLGKGSNVQPFSLPTEAVQKMAETSGSIYVVSGAYAVTQKSVKLLSLRDEKGREISPYRDLNEKYPNIEAFKQPGYPLRFYLYVIVDRDGGKKQQAGEAYVNLLRSEEGQNLLEEVGFGRLSADELQTNCST
jgi:phosphate transport system substrate-binding protein